MQSGIPVVAQIVDVVLVLVHGAVASRGQQVAIMLRVGRVLRMNNVLVMVHASVLRLGLRRCHQLSVIEVLRELGRRLIPSQTLHLRFLRGKSRRRRWAAAAPLADVGILRVVVRRGAVRDWAWVEVRRARHVNSHSRVHCRCIVYGRSFIGRTTLVAGMLHMVAEERLMRGLDTFASLLLGHLVVDGVVQTILGAQLPLKRHNRDLHVLVLGHDFLLPLHHFLKLSMQVLVLHHCLI